MNNRILFLVNIDWFFISHRLPLALEALRKGYEVHIVCAITNKKDYLESLGFNIHPLNISRSGTGVISEIKSFFEIYKILKNVNPQIAHFVTIKPVLYGGIASRFLNISKKVFAISGLGFIFIKQGFKASLIRFIVKRMYQFALSDKNSYVIVQNPDDKKIIESIVKTPTFLIRGSGVDLNAYKYFDENNEDIKISMACRLLKDKGIFEYIEAAKILKNKFKNVEFELYGDIDIHNPASLTESDIKEIKKDNIIKVYGFSSDISTVFSNSNIVVLPSYREGLPKVLLEAAACGRAVVTTDVPGCRDAIKVNKTGLLCKVKDSNSLAEEIEKLIINRNLRISMGKAGRELAINEFNIKKVIEKHFAIYEGKI